MGCTNGLAAIGMASNNRAQLHTMTIAQLTPPSPATAPEAPGPAIQAARHVDGKVATVATPRQTRAGGGACERLVAARDGDRPGGRLPGREAPVGQPRGEEGLGRFARKHFKR